MGKLARDAIGQIKEIMWAVFLLDLVLAFLVLLFGAHVGYATMVWICLGFGLFITTVFCAIFAINLIFVAVIRGLRVMRGRKDLL